MSARKMEKSVLVVGAGVGGVKASLDLAESGFKVYLCDLSPDIGGTLMQMDKWFPNSHCGLCQMLPLVAGDESAQFCLRRGLNHPNIEFLPLTRVEKLKGKAGNFTVTLKSTPSGVRRDLCTGCGLCAEVCPVEVANEFNQGLDKRKAIYIRNPMVAANAYLIDWDSCTRCGLCAEKCPVQAIDLEVEEETRDIKVGAVVLSTGFEEFNARLTSEYGYQRFANIVTSIEMERILSPGGPSGGELVRPSDGKAPKSLTFIQCVGSREIDWNYCSSACCMYALKEAILAKEASPDIDVTIYYMDIRAFGKGNYKYYLEAKDKYGVRFVRGRVPVIKEDPQTGNILITARSEDGRLVKQSYGMVVLSVGQVPSPGFAELSEALGVDVNQWGFCLTGDFSPVETSKSGVYVCGSASSPKDIADTLVEAGAAACQVARLLAAPGSPAESAGEAGGEVADEDPMTAVVVCDCGGEIGSVVDINGLVEYSRGLGGVVLATQSPYLCQKDALDEVIKELKKSKANRLIFAGCPSSIGGGLITKALKEAGLGQAFTQFVNLREGVAWVHKEQPEAATKKAQSLVAMAAERARLQKGGGGSSSAVHGGALVIGGGLSGMISALSIADQGYEVHLVEKSAELGGNLRHIHTTLKGDDPEKLLADTVKAIESSKLIKVYKETEVKAVSGYAGNFVATLASNDKETPLEVGAIVIATGGSEYKPAEYLYGKSDSVVTQSELEQKLASGEIKAEGLSLVVMVQCVGSRNADRPYCSRICCSQALKNALEIKKRNPEAQIFVLYRDMMSYGFMEEYYTRAREAGVLFVRHDIGTEPEVRLEGDKIKVEFGEPVLGDKLVVEPDLLVLSPAVLPQESNPELAGMMGLELTDEGFFKEAEVKFRPVDFNKEGIFACGLALSPRNIGESIVEAQAAAQSAVTLLSRGYLQPSAVVAEVNERWCTGCEMCIAACPYGARVKDPEKGVVVVREALCYGCGACAAACPSGASRLRRYTGKQILSMIDAGF